MLLTLRLGRLPVKVGFFTVLAVGGRDVSVELEEAPVQLKGWPRGWGGREGEEMERLMWYSIRRISYFRSLLRSLKDAIAK